jgi:hypothetical protein
MYGVKVELTRRYECSRIKVNGNYRMRVMVHVRNVNSVEI